jgi:hypothetical protein
MVVLAPKSSGHYPRKNALCILNVVALQNAFLCSELELVSDIPRERVWFVEVAHYSTYLVSSAISFLGIAES